MNVLIYMLAQFKGYAMLLVEVVAKACQTDRTATFIPSTDQNLIRYVLVALGGPVARG